MCAANHDYRSTIFLPKTAFPMRAGLPKREPGWLARWETLGIYDRLRAKAAAASAAGTPRPDFVLHDGPPYANGHLHIGHALNKVLKDFITRSQQMMGHDARYVPGWDCHGLPIEWKIEEQYREKGLDKDAVDTVAFRQECRRFAEHWVDVQREEFKRLGVIGNWADPYLTMDYHAEAVIAEEFLKFLMNGSLYQGSKPVMWSPVERTALAEAEVEYKDTTSHAIWVRFKIVSARAWQENKKDYGGPQSPNNLAPLGLDNASVLVWTTTPWTIPQNKAIAFGEDISYGLYRVIDIAENSRAIAGEKLLIADALADSIMDAANVTHFERLRDLPSKGHHSLVRGLRCQHPYHGLDPNGEWNKLRYPLPGEFVTDDAGTGFVHSAPSHGEDDYQLYLRFRIKSLAESGDLQLTYDVEPDGTYRADLPLFGGQAILTPEGREGPANVSNIRQLDRVGALFAKGRIKHSYPHSWRSKAPIIYLNTPQWFAAIDRDLNDGMDDYGTTIRQRALTSIEQLVKFTPPAGRNRLHAMISQRPDWVLSRQRAWGVPLTAFTKKGARPDDPDFLLKDATVNARIVAAFEAEGADVWYMQGFKERVLDGIVNPSDYEQVMDVLDVWFDSGSTHAFVLRDRPDGTKDGLADLYLEGTDQHRGWFHSSLLQACGTRGRAPYHGVLTHGFTLDQKGMKMSKSLGNTVAPQEVISDYGADILRLWVAQSDYTGDLRIGKEILKGVADSYRRLRNTLRFLLGALGDFDPTATVAPADMPELERWVLHRLAEIDAEVRAGYAAYDFQGVMQKVFAFCTSDLSSLYFDVIKDVLYCDAADSPRRRAALVVLDLIWHRLVTWLAPVLAFTMEEVWLERFPGDESSVHLVDFPTTPAEWHDPALGAKWARVRQVRRVVTAALEVQRTAKVIGAALEAAPVVHITDAELRAAVAGVDMARFCITSAITITDAPAPAGAFILPEVPGVAVVFALAPGAKCERCWQILPDVGQHQHPATCARCDAVLTGQMAPAG